MTDFTRYMKETPREQLRLLVPDGAPGILLEDGLPAAYAEFGTLADEFEGICKSRVGKHITILPLYLYEPQEKLTATCRAHDTGRPG